MNELSSSHDSDPSGSSSLAEQMATLRRVNHFMSAITDGTVLLQRIMEDASATVGASASSIALYEPESDQLVFTVTLGSKGDAVKEIRIPMGQGVVGEVAVTRTPLVVHDAQQDDRFDSSVDRKTGFETRSIMAIPMERGTDLVGVLEVFNKAEGQFTDADQQLLEIVGAQAAIAIENARLYTRLAEQHGQLETAHQELIDTQQQLIQAQRLSTVGRMAASIVHDFKNPMGSIRFFCEMLAKSMLGEDEIQDYANDVLGEIDRFVGMTHELMDFARGETRLEISNQHVGEFFESITSFLDREFSDLGIALSVDAAFRDDVPMDAEKLRRVFFNLASNARDVMQGGGTLTLRSSADDEWVQLEVNDTGPGIPTEIRENLFEAFVTHGKKHGTGLGLAIVKKILEDHGGTIEVSSRTADDPPSGTTFTLRLPRSRPATGG